MDYVPLLSLRMTHPLHNLPKVGFLHNLLSACWQGTMCPFMSFTFADVFFDLVCIGWQEEAVNKVVDTMDDYSLTQEDFDTIIDLSKFQVGLPYYSHPCETVILGLCTHCPLVDVTLVNALP